AANQTGDRWHERERVAVRAHDEHAAKGNALREGKEDDRTSRTVQTPVARVPDDADHGSPRGADRRVLDEIARPGDALADRVAIREELVRENLIDDDDLGAHRPVRLRECAAG